MPNRFQRPEPGRRPDPGQAVPLPGIASLLDSIDGEELALQREPLAGQSSGADLFAQVLDGLSAELAVDRPAVPKQPKHRRSAPRPLTAPGDLVLIVGMTADAIAVARSMAAAHGDSDLAGAGSLDLPGLARVDDRRTAVRARALGVLNSRPVYLAFGLDLATTEWPVWETIVSGISPDQVWVAVDAGRKPNDTARWVAALAARVPVDALAVEGGALTATPHTVEDLDLPIGWLNGAATPGGRPAPTTIWDS